MRFLLGMLSFSIITASTLVKDGTGLIQGKFGQAVDLANERCTVEIDISELQETRPLTFSCWVKFNGFDDYNIIMSVAPKTGDHWEVYTARTSGRLSVYMPAVGIFQSFVTPVAGQWHYLAFRLETNGFELYLDGEQLCDRTFSQELVFDDYPLILGGIYNDTTLYCDGAIDDLVISCGTGSLEGVMPSTAAQSDSSTLAIFDFDEIGSSDTFSNAVAESSIEAFLYMSVDDRSGLVSGKFGQAVDLASDNRTVEVDISDLQETRPLTFSCWVKLNSFDDYNIIMSVAPKTGNHWEVYTARTSGRLSVYMPAVGTFPSSVTPVAGQWHYLAFRLETNGFELYLDGEQVFDRTFSQELVFDDYPLILGGIYDNTSLYCDGMIDDLVISRGTDSLEGVVPSAAAQSGSYTVAVFNFDEINNRDIFLNTVAGSSIHAVLQDAYTMPFGDLLDEVEEEERNASTLHGDAAVEMESLLPSHFVTAQAGGVAVTAPSEESVSLNGDWLLQESGSWNKGSVDNKRLSNIESTGVSEGWFKEDRDRSDWRQVTVPTTVQNALFQLGEIENPFYDANTYDELQQYGSPQELSWNFRHTRIETNDWWFAREFELPVDWDGKRIRLSFDGLDYSGSVYLNGRLLGYHKGMFGGPDFDISKAVRFGIPNTLIVRVDRTPNTWRGILKGSPGWGWHYGHMISVGIWRDVTVRQIPDTEICTPYVRTQSLNDDTAVLIIEYDVINHSSEACSLTVSGTIDGENFTSDSVNFVNSITAPCGRSRWQTEVTIDQPKPWWPLNYGDQNLYEIQLTGGTAAVDAVFGIRTIEMQPLCGTKALLDYRWQFVINGVPMFIKGANWCWSDPMLQLDADKYEHILELARRAGIQMFRAWGGGIIETDEFYHLCDEKGLMVYQEFPYCWGPPSFPMTDGAILDQQVSRVVKRLRNHPALVMWGGGNENVDLIGADEGLFLVGRRCRQFDPSRPFHRTDPWGGGIHNWAVYHGGEPIDSGVMKRPAPFIGEFGLPSMPNQDACLKFLPESKLEVWPPAQDDGGVIAHMNQFGYGDLAKTMRYADYGSITNWNDYIEYSQMAQGDLIAFAANVQRAGSYLNKSGLWFYKFTDLFPGHSWAVVGFYGQPKLSYYRAKQVYAPQAAFAVSEKYDWSSDESFYASLHVGNDCGDPLSGAVVHAVIYGSDLTELWSQEYDVPAMEISSRVDLDPVDVTLPADQINPFLLAVSLYDSEGQRLSDQWQWFNFRVKSTAMENVEEITGVGWPHDRAPEAFEAYANVPEARLLNLPRTALEVEVQRTGSEGVVIVKNLTSLPAFNVIIDGFPLDYGNFLDDNSFFLYPQEERTIGFKLATLDVSLDDLSVRAWNADPVAPY